MQSGVNEAEKHASGPKGSTHFAGVIAGDKSPAYLLINSPANLLCNSAIKAQKA
jgi:hypothetical protein